MKNWRNYLWVAGVLLLIASLLVYIYQVASCYPSAAVWHQFTPYQQAAFRKICSLNYSNFVRFSLFLDLFVPGALLFTIYWLISPLDRRQSHNSLLGTFLVLMMLASLVNALYGLLNYPLPTSPSPKPTWTVELIGLLGFLTYFGTLATWRWKRWGVVLFYAAAILTAGLVLISGGPVLVAGLLILGVLILPLLLRPFRTRLS